MPTPENLRVSVEAAEPLTDGEPNLRVPLEVAEPLTGGDPDLHVSLEVAEPLSGGDPDLREAQTSAEPLSGGQPNLRSGLYALEVLTVLPPEAFMATLLFPTLRGRSWSTSKKPTFSTRTDLQQSGKEVRSANYPNPRWEFDLTYQWLPGSLSPSPSTTDVNIMKDFFLQCQGSWANFLYSDTTEPDYQVRRGFIANSDGVTLQWPWARQFVSGGFLEPVGQLDLSTVATFAPSDVNTGASSIFLTMGPKYTGNSSFPLAPPVTGDGPFFVSATGTLPAGLSAATPYWVIVTALDTVQLAKSRVAALAGTFIVLTSQGTGSLSLSKGYSVAGELTESHTVPATGPYTITVGNAATFLTDYGVTHSGVALTPVSGAPGPGQYAVNPATGVYTFNAAQASAPVAITYSFQYPPADYSVVMPNQLLFASAPPVGIEITADFDFYFVCRFLDDVHEYEEFMSTLTQLGKCNFVAIPQ